MAILNYTTKVDAKKTVAEIQDALIRGKCKRVIIDYDDAGNPAVIQFSILWNNQMAFFQLPCKVDGVYGVLQRLSGSNVRPWMKTKQQAYAVAWRIIKDWVEAQLAIVEADQASMAEVFLPYAITKDGKTLFEKLQQDNSQLLIG